MTSEQTSMKSTIAITIIAAYALLFFPFWQALIIGGILGSSIHYGVRKIKTRFHFVGKKTEWTSLGFIFLFVGFLCYQVVNHVLHLLQPVAGSPGLFTQVGESFNQLKALVARWVPKILGPTSVSAERVEKVFNNTLSQLQTGVLDVVQAAIGNLPQLILALTFTILVAVYFSIGTPKWLQQYSPIRHLCKSSPITWEEFEAICATSVGSLLLIGVIQAAIIAGACLYIGTPNITLIFIGTLLLSFIPLVGAGSVPFVLMIYYYSAGDITSALVMLGAFGIGSTIDNVLRAALFSRLSNNNAIVSFFAVIGSIMLFGLPGLLIAPVLEQLAARVIPGLHQKNAAKQAAAPVSSQASNVRKPIHRKQEVYR